MRDTLRAMNGDNTMIDYSKYATAFSPDFQVYVKIEKVYQNKGKTFLVCSSKYDEKCKFKNLHFTPAILDDFCL